MTPDLISESGQSLTCWTKEAKQTTSLNLNNHLIAKKQNKSRTTVGCIKMNSICCQKACFTWLNLHQLRTVTLFKGFSEISIAAVYTAKATEGPSVFKSAPWYNKQNTGWKTKAFISQNTLIVYYISSHTYTALIRIDIFDIKSILGLIN